MELEDADACEIAGYSRLGRPIRYEVIGSGEETVLFLATIHGDESAGTPLLHRLAEELSALPSLRAGRRIVVVPVCNPDGYASGRRRNDAGVDLNRNFPAPNFSASRHYGSTPLSEPESIAVHGLITRYEPTRIISIHQPLACIDYDGPGHDLAAAMACEAKLPVRKLGGRAGSLGSYAGVTLGIPTITVELPRGAHHQRDDALWGSYGRMLLRAIDWPTVATSSERSGTEVGEENPEI
jgi:protein MpaA